MRVFFFNFLSNRENDWSDKSECWKFQKDIRIILT